VSVELGNWPLKKINDELIAEWEALFASGETRKGVARDALVPLGIVKRWLDLGAESALEWYEAGDETRPLPVEARLHLRCEKARGEFVAKLREQLVQAGAGKESSPGSAGWMLERLESDEWGLSQRLEITGQDGGPLLVEGRAAVGWADLFAIAQANGYEHLLGLSRGGSGVALPPADEVLPDPPDAEHSADALPGVRGS